MSNLFCFRWASGLKGARPRRNGIIRSSPVSCLLLAIPLAIGGLPPEGWSAARPLRTEESPLVPAGEARISLGFELAESPAGLKARAGVGAVTLGLGRDVDLTLEGAYLRLSPPGGTESRGAGDPTVTMRARLSESSGPWPGTELSLGAKLPSGDHERGLGTEETDFLCYLHLGWPRARVRFHINLGVTVVGLVEPPHQQEDSFLHGFALEVPLRERTRVVADLFGEHLTNLRRNPFSYLVEHDEAVLVGLRQDFAGATWDLGLLRTLRDGSGGWGATFGVTGRLGFASPPSD